MSEENLSPQKVTFAMWMLLLYSLVSQLVSWWKEASKDGVIDASELAQIDDIVLAAFRSAGAEINIQLNEGAASDSGG